ncbi:protein FAM151A [Chanos chanos]|uniref:Protein FAM151A n=1 Tax=Chanos chanos TaxID=29144 RepID=A0A6J2VFI9_CHACN|nr:protein FAM151A [Chanos chanos]
MAKESEEKKFLGVFTKTQFGLLCAGIGILLLIIVIVPVVIVTTRSGSSRTFVPSSTDEDMLEFLLQNGEIQEKDALLATWYHGANNKSEMNKALKSEVMILEADVTVEGYGTANETSIPIMAHPPDIYSDNTLEAWLDAVLMSRKGIKLDFKSIEAVEPSLDILRAKNQTGINRPVWLNADILIGPNVPSFWPKINGTRFFELIQQKFPDVTISPGWKVLYLPFVPNATYTESMVKEMYEAVRHMPQKITFPILAVMAKDGWPHISWLLSRSSRFSLTLWQGSENPTVNDLLFIRDNSNPQRVYYDIYEPVLSQFKEAAKQRNRLRRFYPGGDIVDYFKPKNNDGLHIQWKTVTDRASLETLLTESSNAMLVISVVSGTKWPRNPVVEGSNPELSLQECLELILASNKQWGIYLRVKSQNQLASSLHLLRQAYDRDLLHHPVWLNMNVSHGDFHTRGYITGQKFLSTVNEIFPYVTLAPSWPQEALGRGYTPRLVDSMVQLFQKTWQDISLQLQKAYLEKSDTSFQHLLQAQKRFSITVERGAEKGIHHAGVLSSAFLHEGNPRRFYIM